MTESTAKIDWLTLTSFDNHAYGVWRDLFPRASLQDSKVLQYVGKSIKMPNGSGFVGTAMMGLRTHHMLRLSGGSAHMALYDDPLHRLVPGILDGWAKCTRMDVQMTIVVDKDIRRELWASFNRRQRSGEGTVGWAESRDEKWGKLATLYLGSRSSNQFMRVYMKPSDNEMRLRAELELKGAKAASAARQAIRPDGRQLLDRWILHHMQKKDEKLFASFINVLSGIQPERIRTEVKEESKRGEWLQDSVLPAFTAYVMSHDADPEIIEQFSRVIESKMRDCIG